MTLGPDAQKFWDGIPEKDRREVEARAEKRIAEYRNLQEVRKAAGLTKIKISRELHVPQSNISRMEKSSDKLLSFSDIRANLLHFRTSDNREVDFVLERPDGTLAG